MNANKVAPDKKALRIITDGFASASSQVTAKTLDNAFCCLGRFCIYISLFPFEFPGVHDKLTSKFHLYSL